MCLTTIGLQKSAKDRWLVLKEAKLIQRSNITDERKHGFVQRKRKLAQKLKQWLAAKASWNQLKACLG